MSKTIKISTDWNDDTPYDLDNLFKYACEAPFELPTEAEIYACVMGENDESEWHWIFSVDGKFYYAHGGCDYTGWDCRSWGEIEEHPELLAALQAVPEVEAYYNRRIRHWLKEQIAGKEMIGVVKL